MFLFVFFLQRGDLRKVLPATNYEFKLVEERLPPMFKSHQLAAFKLLRDEGEKGHETHLSQSFEGKKNDDARSGTGEEVAQP